MEYTILRESWDKNSLTAVTAKQAFSNPSLPRSQVSWITEGLLHI
jgi:hypothetical protein